MDPSKARLAAIPLVIAAIVTGSVALFGALELDNTWRAAADGAVGGIVMYLAGRLRD